MITIPSWLAFSLPVMFTAGMFLGLWIKRDDYQDGYDDGYAEGYEEARDDVKQAGLDPDELQVNSKPALGLDGSGLDPELPDWTDAQLRALRGDDPGETTSPFTITDLDGQDERIAAAVRLDSPAPVLVEGAAVSFGPGHRSGGPKLSDQEWHLLAAGQLPEVAYPRFTDLSLPPGVELEETWAWGKAAWQIVDLRRFVDQMPEGIAA